MKIIRGIVTAKEPVDFEPGMFDQLQVRVVYPVKTTVGISISDRAPVVEIAVVNRDNP